MEIPSRKNKRPNTLETAIDGRNLSPVMGRRRNIINIILYYIILVLVPTGGHTRGRSARYNLRHPLGPKISDKLVNGNINDGDDDDWKSVVGNNNDNIILYYSKTRADTGDKID